MVFVKHGFIIYIYIYNWLKQQIDALIFYSVEERSVQDYMSINHLIS
jgi:hypothetical protein